MVCVHHASPLHTQLRPPPTLGIIIPVEEAILFRIGIDDAAHRSMFGCHLRLDTPPSLAISRNDNCAFHGNPEPIQLLVVLAVSIVHIYKRRGYVAIHGVRVVGRQLLSSLISCRIRRHDRFLELCPVNRWPDHFQNTLFGRGKENLESLDVRVISPLLELRQNPLRIFLVVGRPDMMRTSTQALHVIAQVVSDDAILKLSFPIALAVRRLRCKARQRSKCGGSRDLLRCTELKKGKCQDTGDQRSEQIQGPSADWFELSLPAKGRNYKGRDMVPMRSKTRPTTRSQRGASNGNADSARSPVQESMILRRTRRARCRRTFTVLSVMSRICATSSMLSCSTSRSMNTLR